MQQSKYLLRMKDSVRAKMRVCLSDANGEMSVGADTDFAVTGGVEQTLHLRETLAEKVIPGAMRIRTYISWRSR